MERMRYFISLSVGFALAFAGCSRPAENSTTTTPASTTSPGGKIEPAGSGSGATADCPNQFYYYNQEKISLKMKPHFLIVGFQPGTSPENRTRILKQFPEYETATQEQTTDAAPFQVIKLRSGTTCARAVPILQQLRETPEVLYANPVFNAPAALGSGTAWIGLTSEFLVNLKSPAQKTELNALVAQTRTKIVEELGETTYLIQATKNSQGNALEMANFFHEQPFVSNAEPDFYVAAQTGGLQNK